jgi:predicted unusual protein kinase regulating ubiquinone biosynthesis (AarF/ABC1/UbiB family)
MSNRPQYDPHAVDQLLSLRHPQLGKALRRFWAVLGFAFKVWFYTWWDAQIWSYLGADDIERAQSIRRRAHARWVTEQMLAFGPTFIKIGQSISTRVDLIRKEAIDELAKLQDRVPPFPIADVRRIITEELGRPPEDIFAWFDPEPLAAASLGQVHRARLHNDQEIILKVQRPNLVETFQLDLAILRRIAGFFQRHTELGRGREWVGIVDEFGQTLFEEINYIQEGRNADAFRKNFRNNSLKIRIPQIYWRYTSRRVLAMEYVPGIKVNDLLALENAGLDLHTLATASVKCYFEQILVHGFYHADPHPGNIAVDTDGSLIFYDFGMVGRIQDKTRLAIVDTFLNIINKKPDRILNNLIELDMLGANADLDVIRELIVWAIDNYYEVPHDQLNLELIADEMAELMYAHPFKLPASFTNMIRALLTLEGVATTLYPSIQFLGIAVDYARQFLGQTLKLEYIVKKSLDFLGMEKVLNPRYPSRVRLQQEEWIPLARYVKTGFVFLGIGQIACFILFLVVIGLELSERTSLPLWLLGSMVFLLCVFSFLTLTVLTVMPNRKKAVTFQPIDLKRRVVGTPTHEQPTGKTSGR